MRHGAIMGTILIAPEGINATIAGSDAAIRSVLAWLRRDPRFADLVSKESYAAKAPFGRLKVKIKREIVTMRHPEADPGRQVGTYVTPEHWNALIAATNVIVVDTRNAYEVAHRHVRRCRRSRNAVRSASFPDFVAGKSRPEKHTRIAMFCTGGIRCEKASCLPLAQGFPEVYHLEGGILKYLETDSRPSRAGGTGECFVFDERVALEHGVRPGTFVMCYACGCPIAVKRAAKTRAARLERARPAQAAESSNPAIDATSSVRKTIRATATGSLKNRMPTLAVPMSRPPHTA